MLLKNNQGTIVVSVTCYYMLVLQGVIFILNVDNKNFRLSVTKKEIRR